MSDSNPNRRQFLRQTSFAALGALFSSALPETARARVALVPSPAPDATATTSNCTQDTLQFLNEFFFPAKDTQWNWSHSIPAMKQQVSKQAAAGQLTHPLEADRFAAAPFQSWQRAQGSKRAMYDQAASLVRTHGADAVEQAMRGSEVQDAFARNGFRVPWISETRGLKPVDDAIAVIRRAEKDPCYGRHYLAEDAERTMHGLKEEARHTANRTLPADAPARDALKRKLQSQPARLALPYHDFTATPSATQLGLFMLAIPRRAQADARPISRAEWDKRLDAAAAELHAEFGDSVTVMKKYYGLGRLEIRCAPGSLAEAAMVQRMQMTQQLER